MLNNSLEKGIPNIGNSCYINVLIQTLLHLPSFASKFLNKHYLKVLFNDSNSKEFKVTIEIYLILNNLITNNAKEEIIKSINFLKINLSNGKYNNYNQNDCLEFFNDLIFNIKKELKCGKIAFDYNYFDINKVM